MEIKMTAAHKAAALIPHAQYAVISEHIEAYCDELDRLTAKLEKCPKLYETAKLKEHPAMFHYFTGRKGETDVYVCEFDGIDTFFCFTILNGDLQNAEWGYSSLEEITSISSMYIDFYFEEQSIEAVLFKRYPSFFKKPPSLA